MRISIHVAHRRGAGHSGGSGSEVAHLEEVVTAADDLGLDTVWVAERLLAGDGTGEGDNDNDGGGGGDRAGDRGGLAGEEPVLEAYTALGFLAARSTRVRLGAMVTPLAYRLPELTVRAAATLDTLSGGRARLGVSAGYAQYDGLTGSAGNGGHTGQRARNGYAVRDEHRAHGGRWNAGPGLAPPPLAERFDHVEDLLRLAHRTVHPPVTVAGLGEARMLPLVARYADACNLLDVPHEGAVLRRKLDILAVHCRKAGRPLADIDLSATARPEAGETSAELIARCRRLAALGFDHVVLSPEGPWTPRALGTLAVAAPAIGEVSERPDTVPTVAYIDAYRVPAAGIPV